MILCVCVCFIVRLHDDSTDNGSGEGRIETATHGLQGMWFIHYTTAAPLIVRKGKYWYNIFVQGFQALVLEDINVIPYLYDFMCDVKRADNRCF